MSSDQTPIFWKSVWLSSVGDRGHDVSWSGLKLEFSEFARVGALSLDMPICRVPAARELLGYSMQFNVVHDLEGKLRVQTCTRDGL